MTDAQILQQYVPSEHANETFAASLRGCLLSIEWSEQLDCWHAQAHMKIGHMLVAYGQGETPFAAMRALALTESSLLSLLNKRKRAR